MSNERPIAPPPELVRHWSRFQGDTDSEALWFRIASEAAQWGADQELEACCEWLGKPCPSYARELRAARRPKPPSLKEAALALIDECTDPEGDYLDDNALSIIRRALEALPND
jgi:hypothetical protein